MYGRPAPVLAGPPSGDGAAALPPSGAAPRDRGPPPGALPPPHPPRHSESTKDSISASNRRGTTILMRFRHAPVMTLRKNLAMGPRMETSAGARSVLGA